MVFGSAAQDDATTKFFPGTGHDEEEEEEDDDEVEKEVEKLFLREYWAAVEKFDDDEDVVFFRGIENPDDLTAIAPRGVVFVRIADDQWNAFIRKVPSEGHGGARAAFICQFARNLRGRHERQIDSRTHGRWRPSQSRRD